MSEGWDKLWAEKKVFDLEKLLSEKEAEIEKLKKELEQYKIGGSGEKGA